MKKLTYPLIAAAAIAAVASCSKADGWSVAGTIAGADGEKIALESYNNGNWYVVDSIELKGDNFSYKADAPAAYPDVMRISLGGRSIYFPVDSVDNISITTTKDGFGSSYTLEGSAQAAAMRSIDSVLNASVESIGAAATAADGALKKQLFTTAFDAPSILPLYYLINKTVGGKQLFDLNNPADTRLYGAVAQRFITERPDDPRTAYLESRYTQARKAMSGTTASIEVPETGLFEIVRYDAKGNKCSLTEAASHGNVVLLSFTSYGLESSTAYNVILNSLWEKYHATGLDIYQIAFDDDESLWRVRASNLPWTAVWNSTTDDIAPLASYNVGALPATFIIDRQGNLAVRVIDPSDLEKEVKKYL